MRKNVCLLSIIIVLLDLPFDGETKKSIQSFDSINSNFFLIKH